MKQIAWKAIRIMALSALVFSLKTSYTTKAEPLKACVQCTQTHGRSGGDLWLCVNGNGGQYCSTGGGGCTVYGFC